MRARRYLWLAVALIAPIVEARAETRYLECAATGWGGERVSAVVTIDFDTRMVTILSGAFRWQARGAQISDERITWEIPWETRTRSGSAHYTLNRYNGELWVRNAPGVLKYDCRLKERPQKKF
jgi:hypothetical protein